VTKVLRLQVLHLIVDMNRTVCVHNLFISRKRVSDER
jgi:hypothetical protein